MIELPREYLPKNLDELVSQESLFEAQKRVLLNKALVSNDPYEIIKAEGYIKNIESKKTSQVKAFTLSPEGEFYSALGFRQSNHSLSYDLLRSMARTPLIRAIITTRLEQVLSFSEFSEDISKPGWTIRRRKKFFQDRETKLSDKDKFDIEKIATFILNGGSASLNWLGDDFESFLRKITKDSLELDQMCFEVVRNRKGDINEFIAVDGGTIRYSDCFMNEDNNAFNFKRVNGYLPSYVQVWRSQVCGEFYPWEMCLGMRNVSSSVMNNGYSICELEDLVQIVTYLLYGINYNGLFFKQGSNPKGILTLEGNIDDTQLNEFRQHWRSTVAGINNAHKLPVLSGSKATWLDLQHSNKDMEFSLWNDFLMTIGCSIYRIDPSELGLNLTKSVNMFGQDGQKERLDHSRKKGLVPLLKFIQSKFNKYLIYPINPDFEFLFTGVEVEDQSALLDSDVKKATNGFVSFEDMFRKYSGRDYDSKKDTILNSIFFQYQSQKQMGGDFNSQTSFEPEESSNTEEQENPFLKGFREYLEKGVEEKQLN